MYCKVESNRLSWIRHNQDKIRAELYQGLVDALAADGNAQRVGRRIVLPSSFTGGPRHMNQLYHDAMAIVRKMGKPDLFITFTCNPNWSEIKDALPPGSVANDRPDLTGRVFRMKLDALLDELTKDGIMGRVVADVHTVEFQKR
jgi:hypothetical protein